MAKLVSYLFSILLLVTGTAYADLNSELLLAVISDDLTTAEDLVKRGADVNYQYEISLLMLSGSNGSIEMTSFLLEKGADPLTKSDDGDTTVMFAAKAPVNASLLCKSFVSLGVDPLAKNSYENHALTYAGHYNNVDAIEALFGLGVPVDLPGYRGQSAFFKTTYNESFDAADYLLTLGANINHQDEFGYSALFRPALNGKLSVARYLIDKGINVNLRRRNGDTALSVALKNNQTEAAELIRKAGGTE
jgi:ankyrin repeat protein